MIKPILNEFMWWETPEHIDDFVQPLIAYINFEEDGAMDEDSFTFSILTPKYIEGLFNMQKILNGKAIFIVNESSMQNNINIIRNELIKILDLSQRDTWEETAMLISQYITWDYEGLDYYKWLYDSELIILNKNAKHFPLLNEINCLLHKNTVELKLTIVDSESREKENYYCTVMTYNQMKNCINEKGIKSGRATFFVKEFNDTHSINLIKLEINEILRVCSRETWKKVKIALKS